MVYDKAPTQKSSKGHPLFQTSSGNRNRPRFPNFREEMWPLLWCNDSDVEDISEAKREDTKKIWEKEWTILHKIGRPRNLSPRTWRRGDEFGVYDDNDDNQNTEEEVSDAVVHEIKSVTVRPKGSPRRKKKNTRTKKKRATRISICSMLGSRQC